MSNTPEYNKQYYLKNRERLKKAHRKHHRENREYYINYCREWRKRKQSL